MSLSRYQSVWVVDAMDLIGGGLDELAGFVADMREQDFAKGIVLWILSVPKR